MEFFYVTKCIKLIGLEFFKGAADQGDAKSAWALAAMYLGQGAAMGIEADAEQAEKWSHFTSTLPLLVVACGFWVDC